MPGSARTYREIAEFFGLSERTVRTRCTGLQPVQRGGNGQAHRYDPDDYCRHVYGGGTDGDLLNKEQEQARLAKEQADKLARERARDEGRTLDAGECERAWLRVLTEVKANLMAVPRKAAPMVVGMSNIAEIEQHLDDAIRDGLARAVESGEGAARAPAAAEADGQ